MSAESLIATLRREGIHDERVLEAIRRVPRDAFVPEELRSEAWANRPLPIGRRQTISQPFIVALMTERLGVESGTHTLEVGTGCGYQTAILVELGAEVYSIERIPELADRARRTLERVDQLPADLRCGDGWQGWPEEAPFERILVTAAPDRVPDALIEQLAEGGRMVIPVGGAGAQTLVQIDKLPGGRIERREVAAVRFVPLVPEEPIS